jgi:Heterokaryon incompatibility protein (HET)
MNETLMIPASLLLLTLRDEEKEWSGWADAVCINQAEDPEALCERAQQVEMMSAIFSKASMVFVYLGELPEAYDEFLNAAEALDELGPDNINVQIFDNADFPELVNLRLDSCVCDTLNDITPRPWYQRV